MRSIAKEAKEGIEVADSDEQRLRRAFHFIRSDKTGAVLADLSPITGKLYRL